MTVLDGATTDCIRCCFLETVGGKGWVIAFELSPRGVGG
jgi:hypothetical protein